MTKKRIKLSGALLVLGAVLFTSCHKNVPTQPPPPPPPATNSTPPPAAPTITLRANPATIDRGSSTTLQWTAQNATTVRIEPGVGEVNGSGNRQVNPTSSVTYTATATGPGGTASDTARITVNAAATSEAPPIRNTSAPDVQQLFSSNVQTIYFDYDKSEIRPDQMARLQSNAAWLKQNPGVHFTIEGHCDDRGSQEYNLALGDRRANAIKDYLVSQGIAETNMRVISYGEERPVCREESEDCYQRNRRAEFVLNQ